MARHFESLPSISDLCANDLQDGKILIGEIADIEIAAVWGERHRFGKGTHLDRFDRRHRLALDVQYRDTASRVIEPRLFEVGTINVERCGNIALGAHGKAL